MVLALHRAGTLNRLQAATTGTTELRVDGREAPGVLTGTEGRWGAVARVGDVTVVVASDGAEPAALELRRLRAPRE